MGTEVGGAHDAYARRATFDIPEWYAIQTRAKHEKAVVRSLADRSIDAFVPTVRQLHTWSDRKKLIDVPLFAGYAFVQATSWQHLHLSVRTTPGVLGWVGPNGKPAAIPSPEMEAVRAIVKESVAASPYPFLKLGQRVRIRGGCLDGVEGTLSDKNDGRLIISINLIQRSVAIALSGYQVVTI